MTSACPSNGTTSSIDHVPDTTTRASSTRVSTRSRRRNAAGSIVSTPWSASWRSRSAANASRPIVAAFGIPSSNRSAARRGLRVAPSATATAPSEPIATRSEYCSMGPPGIGTGRGATTNALPTHALLGLGRARARVVATRHAGPATPPPFQHGVQYRRQDRAGPCPNAADKALAVTNITSAAGRPNRFSRNRRIRGWLSANDTTPGISAGMRTTRNTCTPVATPTPTTSATMAKTARWIGSESAGWSGRS